MGHKFLVHEPGDMVGVAIEDIAADETVEGLITLPDDIVQALNERARRAGLEPL